MSMGIIGGIKEHTSSWLAIRKNQVLKNVILLTLCHESLLVRAEMPLIKLLNTLIEQSDLLDRLSIIMGMLG